MAWRGPSGARRSLIRAGRSCGATARPPSSRRAEKTLHPSARTVGPTPRHEAAPTRGEGAAAATARAPPPRGRAQERTTKTPSRRRSPEDGAAWRPAPREGARSARRLPLSQSLVIRRRPVLSVMVVASRPFDMVPDGLRAQSGQLFGGRGLLCGGRGVDVLPRPALNTSMFSRGVRLCGRVDGVPAGEPSRRIATTDARRI